MNIFKGLLGQNVVALTGLVLVLLSVGVKASAEDCRFLGENPDVTQFLKLRLSAAVVGSSDLKYVKSTEAKKDPRKAAELRKSLRSLQRKIKKLERSYETEVTDGLRIQKAELEADLLGALGTANVLYIKGVSSPLHWLLPSGSSQLSKDIRWAIGDSNTLVVAGMEQLSHFSPQQNMLYITMPVALNGKFTSRERQIVERIRHQKVSELKINTLGDFDRPRLSPSQAVVGSLRYLSFRSISGPTLIFSFRMPFRTDKVSELNNEVANQVKVLPQLYLQTGRPHFALAVRSADGKWTQSFPEKLPDNNEFSFGSGFDQVRSEIDKSKSTSGPKSDLFLLFGGKEHFTPPDMELLKKLASDTNSGLNSISYVLLNPSQEHGFIYYINTIDIGRGTDTTVYADQLRTQFVRSQALRDSVYAGVPFDPFEVP